MDYLTTLGLGFLMLDNLMMRQSVNVERETGSETPTPPRSDVFAALSIESLARRGLTRMS
jgi:hypothetical protein